MQIHYVGPFDEVEIPSAGLTVKRGESIEVDGELADSLLAQVGNFAKSTTKSKGA